MRNTKGKISYTMMFPVDRPDKNGAVYTKEAVLNALKRTQDGIPILDYSADGQEPIIGVTTSKPYDIKFDEEACGFRFTIDGMLFHAGTCCNINSRNVDGEINGFTITSFGITK